MGGICSKDEMMSDGDKNDEGLLHDDPDKFK